MMDDVAIAGAGPAGAIAAIILARAGLRVRLFDRATFPRHKLCGDTLNPGALAVLQRHLPLSSLFARSHAIDGMVLTGPRRVAVRATYGPGLTGCAITREALDHWLLTRAVAAGAHLEEGAAVTDAVVTGGRVGGVMVGHGDRARAHPARIVIAADGRRSTLALRRQLSAQPPRPRRWAIGAYFTDVEGPATLGEMHVRHGHYIGVAPLPKGVTNACLVMPHAQGDEALGNPGAVLRHHLDSDPDLRARFRHARQVSPPTVLGPMAVDARAAGEPGLLLAGDAAGFIDPMTGDGLRFALAGAELAANVAFDVLTGRLAIDSAHRDLASRRRAAFRNKWRFNRALRSLVSSPAGVSAAATLASVAPSIFENIIRYAGDCPGSRVPASRVPGSPAGQPWRT